MARKSSGLLGLVALGVGAWWLLRRNAAAAAPVLPVVTEEELMGVLGIQSATEDTLAGLKMTGLVPADAIEVYLDPTPGVAPLRAIAGKPGFYAVPSGALEAIEGAGTILPLSGYGQQYYARRQAPGGVFIPYGATDVGMRKLTGGHLQATPSFPSPQTLGDYVQLPYSGGAWF